MKNMTYEKRMELIKADRSYRKLLENLPRYLEREFFSLTTKYSFNLRRKDITRAILWRCHTYYKSQREICDFLQKRYRAPGADFFVETIVFFLKAVTTKKLPWRVYSELSITKKHGALRPDITVWKENKLLAVIECKTQLGYNRDRWKQDFVRRERQIKKIHPSAHCFLLVMCSQNWSGFGKDRRLGKQFFVLSKEWPDQLSENNLERSIVVPIESLFEKILDSSTI